MKKVGIITMISDNYGNRLQNLALQEYLKRFNLEPKTIYNNVHIYNKEKCSIYSIFKKIINKIKHIYYLKKYSKKNEIRKNAFERFNDNYIKFDEHKVLSASDLKGLSDKYDYFIVGSDQVWNPNANRNKEIDFLQFSTKSKNISYAVSFGVTELEEKFKNIYYEGLKNFAFISVREKSGKAIIDDLTNNQIKSEVLIDPTLLISSKEWDKYLKIPDKLSTLENKKYILTYFLGKLSTKEKKEIYCFAKKHKCYIINIMDKNSNFYLCGPSEFIYLEKNAFCIFTDSFHSCVFGLIYRKPFVVYKRNEKNLEMYSRISNLITTFDLYNVEYKGFLDDKILDINYDKVQQLLNLEQRKTNEFFKKIFQSKGDVDE